MKRLVIWLDTGDSPMPSGSRSVEIQETDMETTRSQAQKVVDHMLQDLTLAQNFRSAIAESVPPEPESKPEPTPEPPGQRSRGERERVTGRKGGERGKSAKRKTMRPAKKTAKKTVRKRK